MAVDPPAHVRRAHADDIDAILNLLTEFDLPRAYFEPFYRHDPTYRPEHSWVVEQAGRLVAHVRVFDRTLRCGGVALRVAGVGNVVTARAARGRGFAGKLLRAMLADAAESGVAYSLLGTDIPGLYERFGFAIIQQATVRAALTLATPPTTTTDVFRERDLLDVMRLYDQTNATRTGPTVRDSEYWRGQLAWLREDRDGFRIARATDGKLTGYVRSRATHSDVEMLELAVAPEDAGTIGRQLVNEAAGRRNRNIRGHLPLSLLDVVHPDEREISIDTGVMGRVVNLDAFLHAVEPELTRRAVSNPRTNGVCRIALSAGMAELRMSGGHFTSEVLPASDVSGCLNEFELGHLLFHGYDDEAAELFDDRDDTDILRALFPAQDFVMWLADSF